MLKTSTKNIADQMSQKRPEDHKVIAARLKNSRKLGLQIRPLLLLKPLRSLLLGEIELQLTVHFLVKFYCRLSATMIFKISDFLTPEELEYVTSSLAQAEFVDGKLTAGWHAKLVKNNHQLKHNESREGLKNSKKALSRNALFQTAVRPKIVHSILFSRYDMGMSYGRHMTMP